MVRFKKSFLVLLASFGLILSPFSSGSASAATVDLSLYYPNKALASNRYLEGFNYRQNPVRRSVLWFEQVRNTSSVDGFRMYNSGPEDPNGRCNYDVLSWVYNSTRKATASASLQYAQTRNTCNVSAAKPATDIVYTPAITFLPRYWNDAAPWTSTGSSKATYKEGTSASTLTTKCVGTNNWKAEIIGREVIDPPTGLTAIHWRTTQTTTWTSGSGSTYSGCRPGAVTRWQEDYFLIDSLPIVGGSTTAKGLKRSYGGNLDSATYPDWDVWMDKWQPLPTSL